MNQSTRINACVVPAMQHIAAQIKPMVVHCSAGVGRTGTFCALQICLKKLEVEQRVDLFTVVKHMRTQRMSMIQTADQYELVYRYGGANGNIWVCDFAKPTEVRAVRHTFRIRVSQDFFFR